eukprot:CAMPEP_0197623336 /NCGR_PEP_ID=MMETSP1338-20131121/3376_1 /TAXON_ID=43686 ORGANISM="Pelagodinium beii, Strain RCC1491" /NCGR_SAMPLE_ID=MMETSP1338 /ASSEMBLY_ACC=CAM_ASM_000754 /LENGTH=199 /DNA_ID=CAMNT_0043193277 /DNA_START=44 /DNA_END=643 /DNA_ORIENTATION=-
MAALFLLAVGWHLSFSGVSGIHASPTSLVRDEKSAAAGIPDGNLGMPPPPGNLDMPPPPGNLGMPPRQSAEYHNGTIQVPATPSPPPSTATGYIKLVTWQGCKQFAQLKIGYQMVFKEEECFSNCRAEQECAMFSMEAYSGPGQRDCVTYRLNPNAPPCTALMPILEDPNGQWSDYALTWDKQNTSMLIVGAAGIASRV